TSPTWQQFDDLVMLNAGHELPLTVRRGNERFNLNLNVKTHEVDREKIGEAGVHPFLGLNTKLAIAGIAPGMPAEQAGLKVDDQIVAVNGRPVKMNEEPRPAAAPGDTNPQPIYNEQDIIRIIRASADQPVSLTVQRGSETIEVKATPKAEEGH